MNRLQAQSHHWLSTSRTRQQGAVGHALALQAGLVHQTGAGLFAYLPLGIKVLEKIRTVVDEEMFKIGAVPFSTPILQSADLWRQSGRWDKYGDDMFKLEGRGGNEFALGPTHEEIVTQLAGTRLNSYRQLPWLGYQVTRKFRDEIRPRGGLLRAREFEMLDAYSFDQDQTSAAETYALMRQAYCNVLDRLGLQYVVVEADNGEIGGDFSEMFLAGADSGDDAYVAVQGGFREADKDEDGAVSAIEIGHIFQLGDVYSKPLQATFKDSDNSDKHLYGGCYGMGISRLVAALIEQNHDDKGIVWPLEAAPFDTIILPLNQKAETIETALNLQTKLQAKGFDVLTDWRDEKPGVKFADAALVGIPEMIVLGKGLSEGVIDVEARRSGKRWKADVAIF